MSTRGTADVVFCIDASTSMQPCIDSVRANLASFVEGLTLDRQMTWDLRLDFVAHRATESGLLGVAFDMRSLFYHADENVLWHALYIEESTNTRFFTSSPDEFRKGLQRIDVRGDEAALVGLDHALDFPWRASSLCHRVVIMLTDEPMERGLCVNEQQRVLPEMVEKLHALTVMLFLVAPESPGFEKISEADRSEWEVVTNHGDGLASVDFRKVLTYIGKSVSKANPQQATTRPVNRGLFGQRRWARSNADYIGE